MFYGLVLAIVACHCWSLALAEISNCEGWSQLHDKCYQVADRETLMDFDRAVRRCQGMGEGGRLVVIHSKEEQKFIEDYLLKSFPNVEDFWIGAKADKPNHFKWIDGSEMDYTNWYWDSPEFDNLKAVTGAMNPSFNLDNASGNDDDDDEENGNVELRGTIENGCVEIEAHSRFTGMWMDVPCEKKNLVVCEKPAKTNGDNSIDDEIFKIEIIIKEFNKTIIPLGFIYIQLAYEKGPRELWPWLEWEDVSKDYSNMFFRVLGDQTAEFGKIQEENVPRLQQVSMEVDQGGENSPQQIEVPKNGWSERMYVSWTGQCPIEYRDYIKFKTSGGEVRPRNMAIRIWKRI